MKSTEGILAKIIKITPDKTGTSTKAIEVPQIIYVQPSLREFIFHEYPHFKDFQTSVLKNAVFVIQDCETNFVTDEGALHLNPDSVSSLFPVLEEFFSLVAAGVPLKDVFKAFIEFLTGEYNAVS